MSEMGAYPPVIRGANYNALVRALKARFIVDQAINKRAVQHDIEFQKQLYKEYSIPTIAAYCMDWVEPYAKFYLAGNQIGNDIILASFDPETESYVLKTSSLYRLCQTIEYVRYDGFLYFCALRKSDNKGAILRVDKDLTAIEEIWVHPTRTDFIAGGKACTDGESVWCGISSSSNGIVAKWNTKTQVGSSVDVNTTQTLHACSYDGEYVWFNDYTSTPNSKLFKVALDLGSVVEYATQVGGIAEEGFLDIGDAILMASGLGTPKASLFNKITGTGTLIDFGSAFQYRGFYWALGYLWFFKGVTSNTVLIYQIDPISGMFRAFAPPFQDDYNNITTDGKNIFMQTTKSPPTTILKMSPLYPIVATLGEFAIQKADLSFTRNVIPTDPSDDIQHSLDNEQSTSSTSPTKLKEILFNERVSGAKITFETRITNFDWGDLYLYKNGMQHSKFSPWTTMSDTYEEKTGQCTAEFANVGDLIQIYGSTMGFGTLYVKNFRIKYTYNPNRSATINMN